jgi:predicted small lipoprotein YifL
VKNRATAGWITLSLLVAGCGKVGPLEPRSGAAAPAKAYGAAAVADADALLTPSVQTRPGRSDELMRRSERRNVDPFDLPPGGAEAQEPAEQTAGTLPPESPDQPKN